MEKEKTFLERLGIYFIVFIGISCALELSILAYAFFNADKVECNFLWCSFTDVREQNYKSFTDTYSECYVNGRKVNCSEYKDRFPDYASHGWNTVDGICPGWDDNKSISDCIDEIRGLNLASNEGI